MFKVNGQDTGQRYAREEGGASVLDLSLNQGHATSLNCSVDALHSVSGLCKAIYTPQNPDIHADESADLATSLFYHRVK